MTPESLSFGDAGQDAHAFPGISMAIPCLRDSGLRPSLAMMMKDARCLDEIQDWSTKRIGACCVEN